jgi:hypothetical protein
VRLLEDTSFQGKEARANLVAAIFVDLNVGPVPLKDCIPIFIETYADSSIRQ